jgi:hypothetical protein
MTTLKRGLEGEATDGRTNRAGRRLDRHGIRAIFPT